MYVNEQADVTTEECAKLTMKVQLGIPKNYMKLQ